MPREFCRYYFRMARKRNRQQWSADPAETERLKNPPQLGKFDDPLGLEGRCPGEALLTEVRYAVFEGVEQWYHGRAQLVDGQILAGDGSHKITKSIRVADDKVYHGVYTIVNEFNQVVLQVGTTPRRRRTSFFFTSAFISVKCGLRCRGHHNSFRRLLKSAPSRASVILRCTVSISSVRCWTSLLEPWTR